MHCQDEHSPAHTHPSREAFHPHVGTDHVLEAAAGQSNSVILVHSYAESQDARDTCLCRDRYSSDVLYILLAPFSPQFKNIKFKPLLDSTRKYTQYFVIIYKGKESEKESKCVYI